MTGDTERDRMIAALADRHVDLAAIAIVYPETRHDILTDDSATQYAMIAAALLDIIDRLLIATPDQVDEIEAELDTRARFAFLSARIETEGNPDE